MSSMPTDARWVKLSFDLSETTPLPPGIPALTRSMRQSIARGDVSNLAELHLCNHSGTHMDAPLHFADGGLALTDFDAADFCFVRPLLLDIPLEDGHLVVPEHLLVYEEGIGQCDLLLIRTGFGRYRTTDPERYRLDGPGFSRSAAEYLSHSFPQLRGLGLDTISLASMRELDEGLRAHQALLKRDRKFLILEDLNLPAGLDGLLEVIALPLMIEGMDGGPCAVIGVVVESIKQPRILRE